jgi:hypothetical protein
MPRRSRKKLPPLSTPCFYVDIPTPACVTDHEGGWQNLAILPTKKLALAFIREHIGPCDRHGRLTLLTAGTR